jgi:hypothetical protein
MAAVVFRPPVITITDSNGNPAPGAQLFFYLTGTLTETPIYSNEALTIEHTNPVIADSAGQAPLIYLNSDITYRLRIFDEDDVLLYEEDPYADLGADEILTKLLTVDGSGSGLDADKVRGTTPTATGLSALSAANAGALLGLILPADGSGSGLDADLVRATTPAAHGLLILASSTRGRAAAHTFLRTTISGSNATLVPGMFFVTNISGSSRTATISPEADNAWPDDGILFLSAAGAGTLVVARGVGVQLLWKGSDADRTLAAGTHAIVARRSSDVWDITGSGVS